MKGLVIVWALAAIGGVGALWRPVIGLYVYVFFAILRPAFMFGWAGSVADVSDIVGIAMLVGWTLNGFGSWRLGRGRAVAAALIFFILWVWLSATQAMSPPIAYPWGIELLKILAPFLVGITVLSSPAEWRMMLWVIVVSQAYVGAEMNLAYLQGVNRAYEGYGGMDNNSFGIGLVATLGPAFALTVTEKSMARKLGAAACTAIILHTTLLTFSRGAFVGLLVVGVTAFLMMPKRPAYILALVVAGLLTLRLVGPELASRYDSAFAGSEELDESATSRLQLWLDCFDVAKSRPMFGVGPRNWGLVAADYGWPVGKEAHSVWMQTLAETGFPGVGALALFYGLALLRLWPIARARITTERRLEAGLAAGVVLSIVGFAVAGQFVALAGLEIPYYTTMVGVALLKGTAAHEAATARVEVSASAGAPPRKTPTVRYPAPAILSRPLEKKPVRWT